jgi:hypothetical protein
LALIALIAAAAIAQHAPEPVGIWSTASDWETDQFGEGANGYCVTRSKARSTNGITYTVFMTFGARNEVGMSTSQRVEEGRNASFDVDGGGLELSDLTYRTEGNTFVVFNSLTRPMFRLLTNDLKAAHSISLVLGGRRFSAPIADPDAVYGQMLECQESLIGLVIGGLK